MSGWRDRMQPASFRGVPFLVVSHEAELGRRVAVHEFPYRDEPFGEDLGRKTRGLTIEAYVIGAGYADARNRLVRAIEQAGPGPLKHPYLGELQVNVLSCKLREGTEEGGIARFTIEFVEAGLARFPSSEESTTAAVVATADYAAEAVRASMARRMATASRPAFVAGASASIIGTALNTITGAVAKVRGVVSEVAKLQRDVDAMRRDLVTLVYAPASAAQALLSAVRQLVRSVASTPRDMLSLARTLYRFGADLPAVQTNTTSRKQQALNQAELLQLVRVVAAAEGARAAALVDWESYQEAVAARDELLDVLDDAMLASGVADEVYDALRGLRAAVVRDVVTRGADLARLVTYTPAATRPMLAIAQTVYADGLRADEMTLRNRVRHPLFVAGAAPLEVLADA